MNENGSKSPKMNGIIKIEISQFSKMKQMNQNESYESWMKVNQNHSK